MLALKETDPQLPLLRKIAPFRPTLFTNTLPPLSQCVFGYAFPFSISGSRLSFFATFSISSTLGDFTAVLLGTIRPSPPVLPAVKFTGQITIFFISSSNTSSFL